MGKKSKMLNEDPILKKNFKYEKRKKQREQQKLKLKQQQLEEQNKMKELRSIEKKVQEDIEKIYQQEKQQLLSQNNKTKSINKYQQLIDTFKNKQHPLFAKNNTVDSTKNNDEIFTKNLKEHSLQISQNSYQNHFQSSIPKSTSDLFVKHKKLTQIMKIEQQVKDEIKSMFSVKKVGQNEDKNQRLIQENIFGQDVQKKREEALEEEQKQEEPFVVQKKGKAQTQILVKGKIFAATQLALKNSNLTKSSSKIEEQIGEQQIQKSDEYETAQKIVNSYIDYVHVENNQEQTIEEFRKVVITHMYQHQKSCIKALKEDKKAKGFTNAKYLIITPYVGDAKAIFEQIEQQFMKDQEPTQIQQVQNQPEGKKKKRRNLDQWMIENKQKIQENQDDQDDFFRVGIKVLPKKKKIVYFSNFDASDIIVASPIGLKSIVNGEGGKKEISFLSSVEILYVDRASVIMMQNWDHLIDIFQNLNYMPKYESLKNSINQIRPQFLELKGRLYRQNIVFTEFSFPQLNSLKINHFNNWQGCITSRPIFKPLLIEENQKIEKNFYKIELKQPKDDLQSRFQFFKRKFWDKIHNSDNVKKIVLFVNSYFEFVKMKGFLEKVNASFEAISEHTRKEKIQSRVSRFNNGSYRILLLTQRAYYFGLCQIKKQKHIYFYSLPKNAFIFKDMIENIENDDENKIVCIYSKYDKFIVERLVGSVKAIEMVKEYCTNVSFIV